MRFNAATRTRLLVDVTCDIDPTGSTVELKVDADWHSAVWLGSPVVVDAIDGVPDRWTQTARTTEYFGGPDATPAGVTVLAKGRHLTKARVTKAGDVLVCDSTPVDVK